MCEPFAEQLVHYVTLTVIAWSVISPQHSKQKCNTGYKGAAAHELLIIKTVLELPFYQQEKPKTVPGTRNMQHVSIL